SKPVTDQYNVSRAKLAYIIDSTSAPVVILMPISTWGAYIIGMMGGLFLDNGYTTHSGFSGFTAAIPYQFYPITAVLMVFLIVKFGISFGPMKKFEDAALAGDDISKVEASKVAAEVEITGTKA